MLKQNFLIYLSDIFRVVILMSLVDMKITEL